MIIAQAAFKPRGSAYKPDILGQISLAMQYYNRDVITGPWERSPYASHSIFLLAPLACVSVSSPSKTLRTTSANARIDCCSWAPIYKPVSSAFDVFPCFKLLPCCDWVSVDVTGR